MKKQSIDELFRAGFSKPGASPTPGDEALLSALLDKRDKKRRFGVIWMWVVAGLVLIGSVFALTSGSDMHADYEPRKSGIEFEQYVNGNEDNDAYFDVTDSEKLQQQSDTHDAQSNMHVKRKTGTAGKVKGDESMVLTPDMPDSSKRSVPNRLTPIKFRGWKIETNSELEDDERLLQEMSDRTYANEVRLGYGRHLSNLSNGLVYFEDGKNITSQQNQHTGSIGYYHRLNKIVLGADLGYLGYARADKPDTIMTHGYFPVYDGEIIVGEEYRALTEQDAYLQSYRALTALRSAQLRLSAGTSLWNSESGWNLQVAGGLSMEYQDLRIRKYNRVVIGSSGDDTIIQHYSFESSVRQLTIQPAGTLQLSRMITRRWKAGAEAMYQMPNSLIKPKYAIASREMRFEVFLGLTF
ncbi:MAG: hypothetical protein JNM00_16660 [Flavobacteriales bacterium]|nr:hypothetical protein [Flavobacteriales bacterium]